MNLILYRTSSDVRHTEGGEEEKEDGEDKSLEAWEIGKQAGAKGYRKVWFWEEELIVGKCSDAIGEHAWHSLKELTTYEELDIEMKERELDTVLVKMDANCVNKGTSRWGPLDACNTSWTNATTFWETKQTTGDDTD